MKTITVAAIGTMETAAERVMININSRTARNASAPDPKALEKCPGHCGKPNYKGDGYCDVDNNNCGCAFDGGDCCGTTKRGKLQYAYCAGKANCKCLDPEKGGK